MDIDYSANLSSAITKQTAAGTKMKMVNKEDFKQNLNIVMERMRNLCANLDSFNPQDKAKLASAIFSASNNKSNVVCNMYMNMAKLIGRTDTKSAFDSVSIVAHNYLKLLESIDRASSTNFTEKAITIYNMKLSQVAIVGAISEAEQFIDNATYMLDGATYELCTNNGVRELGEEKQYRISKLQSGFNSFVDVLKNRLSLNPQTLAAELDSLKRGADITLIGNDNTNNLGFIENNKLSSGIKNLIHAGARKFGFFRWIGEWWNTLKHSKFLKQKKEKEWMEAHVALLKLQLQGVDPNSDEYRRLVKIIDSYNEMIAELDSKIDAYLNEE